MSYGMLRYLGKKEYGERVIWLAWAGGGFYTKGHLSDKKNQADI